MSIILQFKERFPSFAKVTSIQLSLDLVMSQTAQIVRSRRISLNRLQYPPRPFYRERYIRSGGILGRRRLIRRWFFFSPYNLFSSLLYPALISSLSVSPWQFPTPLLTSLQLDSFQFPPLLHHPLFSIPISIYLRTYYPYFIIAPLSPLLRPLSRCCRPIRPADPHATRPHRPLPDLSSPNRRLDSIDIRLRAHSFSRYSPPLSSSDTPALCLPGVAARETAP